MKIHAARTCPNSRRLLVRRIEEENWSLMVAAEAGRHQRAQRSRVPLKRWAYVNSADDASPATRSPALLGAD